MRPEAAEPRGPVAVLPLWRRAEEYRDANRPGVLRGHPGPVASDQPEPEPEPEPAPALEAKAEEVPVPEAN
ncbi:hypothetical protein ACFC1T_11545 [Kitasatospora sp. NPDC056076]|uniref:hypothetical protein n=1 Tax=Kitasatospora sp. NPDC056076 TaxID=3345703 RepID=UPI0035E3AF07